MPHGEKGLNEARILDPLVPAIGALQVDETGGRTNALFAEALSTILSARNNPSAFLGLDVSAATKAAADSNFRSWHVREVLRAAKRRPLTAPKRTLAIRARACL
jgi:hypothetical protein